MLIILFVYIAFGSLVNSFLLSLSFINALYFTVTTIETIGFGDIVPDTPGSRIFICFYAAVGIVNLAVVVGMVQETVREGLHIGYFRRLQDIRERRRAAQRRRNAERRWRSAVIWRLRDKGAKVWVRKCRSTPNSFWAKVKRRFFSAAERIPHPLDHFRGKRLNLEALTHAELKAAAMEAGVPLDTLLPPQFYEAQMQNDNDDDNADDLEVSIFSAFLSCGTNTGEDWEHIPCFVCPAFGVWYECTARYASNANAPAARCHGSAPNEICNWSFSGPQRTYTTGHCRRRQKS